MELQEYEKEHLEKIRSGLPECMVLLKTNGAFPLREAGEIALFGNGARRTIKGGTGSGEVNSRFYVTVEEGLEKAGFTVTTKAWLDTYDEIYAQARAQFIAGIKEQAKKKHTSAMMESMGAIMTEPEYDAKLEGSGEVAVYVLARISGEGTDRQNEKGDIQLTDTEIRDILKLRETYAKFMLVLNVDGPVDLSPVAETENILLLSQLGVETGSALADVLLGKETPSGKLTTTWAAWEDYSAVGEFGDLDETRYKEGIFVGYRYFDTIGKRAMFPFGFGLSYTTFSLTPLEICTKKQQIQVSVKVKNTGTFAGKEVVQLYVSAPSGRLIQPKQTLAAFAKTKALTAGEETTVSLCFSMEEIASYDTDAAAYLLEKGDYVLRLGNSSVDTKEIGKIRLNDDIVTKKVKHCCGTPDFTDWSPKKAPADATDEETLSMVLQLTEDAFETETVSYDKVYPVDERVRKLTDEELTYTNMGFFDEKALLGIVGNAAVSVAGAAGETTNRLAEKGFPTYVMADGPAGLRLSREYAVDKDGVHSLGGAFPESVLELVPNAAKWVMKLLTKKPKANAKYYTQYTTAIPIGTAIAQSWNMAFAEQCGDVVGEEMERFGVHLWLAPALNIHRSIQCGRNFEYFSEDPLISGKTAAALTNGVQAHKGCGVTIKHFAANNQERNRYANNSQVSERAMREIYLKGFEICIKEASPKALMTSYNLLNGVHTSERRDLTEDILRCEFGFEGIVMTDWILGDIMLAKGSKHRSPVSYKILAAGGDLIMPGTKADYKNVLEALKSGKLDRKQAQINATRIYRVGEALSRCEKAEA